MMLACSVLFSIQHSSFAVLTLYAEDDDTMDAMYLTVPRVKEVDACVMMCVTKRCAGIGQAPLASMTPRRKH
jgi:hypothetical protein